MYRQGLDPHAGLALLSALPFFLCCPSFCVQTGRLTCRPSFCVLSALRSASYPPFFLRSYPPFFLHDIAAQGGEEAQGGADERADGLLERRQPVR